MDAPAWQVCPSNAPSVSAAAAALHMAQSRFSGARACAALASALTLPCFLQGSLGQPPAIGAAAAGL
eukprot:362264-Prymnesium_polylepis.1